jgi:hypothetical protein
MTSLAVQDEGEVGMTDQNSGADDYDARITPAAALEESADPSAA